jgi:hypothetical protein
MCIVTVIVSTALVVLGATMLIVPLVVARIAVVVVS